MLAWALVATAAAVILAVALIVQHRRANRAADTAAAALRAADERAGAEARRAEGAEQRAGELTAALAAAEAGAQQTADELATVRQERQVLETLLAARDEELAGAHRDLEAARAALAGTERLAGAGDQPAAVLDEGAWELEVRRARRRWREIVPLLPGEPDHPDRPAGPVAAQLAVVLGWTLERLREEAGTHTGLHGTAPDIGPRAAILTATLVEELATALARTADEVTVTLAATEHGWLAVTVDAPWDAEVPPPWPDGLVEAAAQVGATLHLDPVHAGRVQARLYVAP